MSTKGLEIARIAAQLARQPVAASMTVDEIAKDAVQLHDAAGCVRGERGGDKPRAALEGIAGRYHARLSLPRDSLGMAVGLKFDGAPVSCGFQDVFFVA